MKRLMALMENLDQRGGVRTFISFLTNWAFHIVLSKISVMRLVHPCPHSSKHQHLPWSVYRIINLKVADSNPAPATTPSSVNSITCGPDHLLWNYSSQLTATASITTFLSSTARQLTVTLVNTVTHRTVFQVIRFSTSACPLTNSFPLKCSA